MNGKRFSTSASIALLAFAATVSWAQDGYPDSSFGTEPPQTLVSFGAVDEGRDRLAKVLVTPDENIFLVGTSRTPSRSAFTIVRLRPDGTPDPQFNGNGQVISSPPGETRDFNATTAALQSDGKLLVAGYVEIEPFDGDRDLMICRFTTGGDLDIGFGGNGAPAYPGCREHAFNVGGSLWDVPLDMIVEPGGRVVLAGYSTRLANRFSGLTMRLTSQGELDPTYLGHDFVGDGWSLYPPKEDLELTGMKYTSLVRSKNGEMIFGGYGGPGSGDPELMQSTVLVITQTAVDGFPIAQITEAGYADLGEPMQVRLTDLEIVADSSIFAVGSQEFIPGSRVTGVAKYLISGLSPDKSFAQDGYYTDSFCQLCEDTQLISVVAQADERLVVAGVMKTDRYRFFAARLTKEGVRDESFGDDGVVITELVHGSADEVLTGVALHANRPLLGGRVSIGGSDSAYGLTRLANDRIFFSGVE